MSSVPTREQAERIRERGIFAEVATCFWKEEPAFREVLDLVKSLEIYVVPNFISEGYFTRTVIPREMRLQGSVTRRDGRILRYCKPVGSHSSMTDLLLREVRAVAGEVDPAATSLVLVGHGTRLNARSADAARWQAERILAMGIYPEVTAAFMEDDPLIAEWDQFTSRPNVIVVPFFIADGLHSDDDIPVLLGLWSEGERTDFANVSRASGGSASLPDRDGTNGQGRSLTLQNDPRSRGPFSVRGRTLFYGGAIGSEPGFAEVLLDQVRTFEE